MVRFTPQAGDVPAMALVEAARLEHRYLGPEHLLLGLLRQEGTLAAAVLGGHGLDLESVRAGAHELIALGLLPSADAAMRAPKTGMPLLVRRALLMACEEARARGHEVAPAHLLLGLLRDAQDPVGTGLDAEEKRLRAQLGLPGRGPHPVRLLVEGRGASLAALRAAVGGELDRWK